MKIGILTGGGDVPGLNPTIKAVVNRATAEGHEVVGIRRGWGGLLHFNPEDPESESKNLLPLDNQTVRTIDRTGGTFLHTSRTNPSKVRPSDVPDFLLDPKHIEAEEHDPRPRDFTPHVLRNLEHLGIQTLIPIGGDDTLSYGERLHSEGFPVVAIPKTMDNDVYGTDYCVGFSTAVTRSVQFIHQLRTSTGSHERIAVVELFGRNSGETSLVSSYLAGVDRAVISEVPFDPEKLAELVMRDKRSNPSNYVMVTISEGAHMQGGKVVEFGETDAYGHRKLGGIGEITGEALKTLTGENIINQRLGYLMRSGAPDALDLMVAVNFANMAMDLILTGVSGRMVALRDGTYTHIPMSTVTSGVKRVDVDELYDVKEYRPKVRHVLGKPMFLY
ncbi:MAG: ATP-dependent 6-phosphofructokinase [Ardenticatenaceae bacterium]|nr:ATP-dependent 6-phosphofructokinase [Anaerolineales bacterium]MCB8921962.1 ATP-dependent 6-phosphofructokinase [Ardenticatenaceae bacterium]MCB8989538.1 ATP-dependent 6-phosphofructokinase [Ardenticatenaceae bacterium]MCB9003081.1 ATP-dependent 6-phosphofructokinase [Ardenticatenaceae bacterium]